MDDQFAGFVKVRFPLEPESSGWPPFASEGIWAEPLGDDKYRLDNVPFFAKLVSSDDIVRAGLGRDGQLWVEEVVGYGDHSTIRVIVAEESGIPDLRSELTALGCDTEVAAAYRLVAIDIPPETSLAPVQQYLKDGERAGRWHYEESCLSTHHTDF